MHDMQVVNTRDLAAVPWKNGGGITREIFQSRGPNGVDWRLSVADVDEPGAFSRFPDMSRILTVIEGDGLELRSPTQAFPVPRLSPFAFHGNIEIHCVLRQGAVRNFNVIFDPQRIKADVRVIHGKTDNGVGPGNAGVCAIFAVQGSCRCGDTGLDEGTCAVFEQTSIDLAVPDQGIALSVQMLECDA